MRCVARSTSATRTSATRPREAPVRQRHRGLHLRARSRPARAGAGPARRPRSVSSTRLGRRLRRTRPYSRPDGSTSTLAANRSPPTWLHSQTWPGRSRLQRRGDRTSADRAADVVGAVRAHRVHGGSPAGRRIAGPAVQEFGHVQSSSSSCVVLEPPHTNRSRPGRQSTTAHRRGPSATGRPGRRMARTRIPPRSSRADQPMRDGPVEPGVEQPGSSPRARLLDQQHPGLPGRRCRASGRRAARLDRAPFDRSPAQRAGDRSPRRTRGCRGARRRGSRRPRAAAAGPPPAAPRGPGPAGRRAEHLAGQHDQQRRVHLCRPADGANR